MEKIAAVLTGDLVASQAAGTATVDAAMAVLARAADRMATDWLHSPTFFTRYRGDGWQVYLDVPGLVLRGCLYLTASLRASGTGLETRISAGVGTVERIGPDGLASASGEAFTLSGQNLDDMERNRRLLIGGRGFVTPWHEAIFDLVEFQASRWSREQAEAVMHALDPREATQAEIAARLGITRQALQARLRGAGLSAMTGALLAFEGANFPAEAAA